jgi:hypothetical protein
MHQLLQDVFVQDEVACSCVALRVLQLLDDRL